jgi:hypothetical protein
MSETQNKHATVSAHHNPNLQYLYRIERWAPSHKIRPKHPKWKTLLVPPSVFASGTTWLPKSNKNANVYIRIHIHEV